MAKSKLIMLLFYLALLPYNVNFIRWNKAIGSTLDDSFYTL